MLMKNLSPFQIFSLCFNSSLAYDALQIVWDSDAYFYYRDANNMVIWQHNFVSISSVQVPF